MRFMRLTSDLGATALRGASSLLCRMHAASRNAGSEGRTISRDAAPIVRRIDLVKRYFFHLQDGLFKPDLVGIEHASLQAARSYAIDLAASVLAAQNGPTWETIDWQVTVADETGETVFTLNFFGETLGPLAP